MYYAYFKGKGEGCDYTIGCNHALFKIEASNMDEAEDKVRAMFEYDEDHGGIEFNPEEIASVKVFELTQETHLNMELIRQKINEKRQKEEENQKTEADMAEYERLKKKFDN